MVKSYHELLVWQKAHKLVLSIYKITSEFPQWEIYGITRQIRRASYSIPANIVEGCERRHTKELIHFTTLAKSSLSETEYFLLLSKDLGYLTQEVYFDLQNNCSEIGKMLNGLLNSLKNKI